MGSLDNRHKTALHKINLIKYHPNRTRIIKYHVTLHKMYECYHFQNEFLIEIKLN